MTEQQGTWIIELLRKILACMDGPLSAPAVDAIALEAAKRIEDIFVMSHEGGRTQRLAHVQTVIITAITTANTAARESARR